GFKFTEPFIIANICLNYFPIQLIEVLFETIIFFVVKNMENGLPLKIYLLSYAVFRFFVEFFRGDIVRGIWFGLSTSQWISLLIIFSYLYVNYKKRLQNSNSIN
ncbi:MAG: prolipoprotein diacylglyceryl transferase, partial [Oscillospiraceae bacterium]|nr:prolipoprotein diacylglyceryl transferase [Oscillospiraceae bacterium]